MALESIVEKPIIKSPETTPLKIEQSPNPENKSEKTFSSPEKIKSIPKVQEKSSSYIASPNTQTQSWQVRRAAAIDVILAEGLNDIFIKMNPTQQSVFKKAGEEAVTKINQLLSETKVKVNKIVEIIRKWLKLIPGINKFFLEQEVKIKADKIFKIKNKF